MTKSSAPTVSALIPQWGNTPFTQRTVDALLRSTYGYLAEIVVYDNASPEGPGTIAAHPAVTMVAGAENIGFGPAVNRMAALATGQLILIMNNDIVVTPSAVEFMVKRYLKTSGRAIIAPQYRTFDGRILESGAFLGPGASGWQLLRGVTQIPESMAMTPLLAHYASAACLLLDREVFASFGGFDDRFAPAYYEDTDLLMRLSDGGYMLVVEPQSIVYHREGTSAGQDLTAGVKRYQLRNRSRFYSRWAPWLDRLPEPSLGNCVAQSLTLADHSPLILIASPYLPRPDREAGHARLISLIDTLRNQGFGVALWAENCDDPGVYGTRLSESGVLWFGDPERSRLPRIGGVTTPLVTFQDLMQEVPWDLLIIEVPTFAERLLPIARSIRPDIPVVIDPNDLHFLRSERAERFGHGKVASKSEELAIYRSSEGVITASSFETDLLRTLVNTPVQTWPMSAVPPRDPSRTSHQPPPNLMFLGNFNHHPNVDAVEWWLSQIAPSIVEVYGRPIELRIVGSGSERFTEKWASPFVEIGGWVESLSSEFEHCRVFVAPLRFGAGTKGKIYEALAAGVPIVTTRIGAEGMQTFVQEALIIADTAQEIAAAVVRLMDDVTAWEQQRLCVLEAARMAWDEQGKIEQDLGGWLRSIAASRRPLHARVGGSVGGVTGRGSTTIGTV